MMTSLQWAVGGHGLPPLLYSILPVGPAGLPPGRRGRGLLPWKPGCAALVWAGDWWN